MKVDNVVGAANYWRESEVLAAAFERANPARMLTVSYAELTGDPVTVVRRICRFVDIDQVPPEVFTRLDQFQHGLPDAVAHMVQPPWTVLHGDYPARGETAAVPDAVHLVQDRDRGVAGPQEVGVQRVHSPFGVLDGSGGGDEGLARHLAAEHTLAVLVG